MIPKRTKDTDISSEIAQGKVFRKRLMKLVDEVTERFMKGEGLNDAMADVAKREGFSQIQIQRLVEEGNTVAYNKKYATLKKEKDRRLSFELANLEDILLKMGDSAPPKVDNPNIVTGKSGEGEIKKEASAKSLFNLNTTVERSREKLMEKRAFEEKKVNTKEQARLTREIKGDIFKVASCLVRTEQLYKNANTIYNTLIADARLNDEVKELIEKRSHDISSHLVQTGRTHAGFVVSLKEDYMQKIANNVLGEQSLLNQPLNKQETPKIAPVPNVSDYEKLLHLAKKIQQQQEQSMNLDA